MTESKRLGLVPQLDIEQILLEAQHRWLRPAEICEILKNYRKFRIAPESPHEPPSGSLFLFDRKVLRYFRKDGHNWRKKKDGKTVKEAHERLKADSVDVLHCYYAHGEENENFQRRTYWMLEEAFMHIVLVHYLEVKGSKASFSCAKDDGEILQTSYKESPACSVSFTSQSHPPSHTMETGSQNSAQISECEDAESDIHQGESRHHTFLEMQRHVEGLLTNVNLPTQTSHQDMTKVFDEAGLGFRFKATKSSFNGTSWEGVLGNDARCFQSLIETSGATELRNSTEQDALVLRDLFRREFVMKRKDDAGGQGIEKSQLLDAEGVSPCLSKTIPKSDLSLDGNMSRSSLLRRASLDLSSTEGLIKYDSFSRWMSKELGEVDASHMESSSQSYWNFMVSDQAEDSSLTNSEHFDAYTMSPSVSQDQLFSIIDFSPNWATTDSESKVIVTGTFLKNRKDLENFKWSCMFGEVEVPAEIVADGVLRCEAPPHRPGMVPFYITCSNRLACSEVREFEYRDNHSQYMDKSPPHARNMNEIKLGIRLEKLLSLGSLNHSTPFNNMTDEKRDIRFKISSQLMDSDDEWLYMLERTKNKELSADSLKDHIVAKLLKEQLHNWLHWKVAEGGKGPSILDKEGQGVLHIAAALDYHWAIKPTVTAGVNINFRDARGWTALHWAASCGRERMVVYLITLGAASGALTDPTPDFPSGRTPADLASTNGYKGIAGFLAEASLTSHLETLTLKETGGVDIPEVTCIKHAKDIVENYDGDNLDGPSMKDSLTAVRNATLAAARIHQVFRVQSFQRKRLVQQGTDLSGMLEEQAVSLISVKTNKSGQHHIPAHAAAVCIQNKFRGWKGRREFLILRQRIVKIQAHVRGHQVRKRYKKIVWTVGIMEKVILRWRRKGCGLRGFRSEGLLESSSDQAQPPEEDEYDFLHEGRKQTEARMQKALARVKSMVQYPEARDQYSRLLTVVSELQESKELQDKSVIKAEDAVEGNFVMEFEELLQEDQYISSQNASSS